MVGMDSRMSDNCSMSRERGRSPSPKSMHRGRRDSRSGSRIRRRHGSRSSRDAPTRSDSRRRSYKPRRRSRSRSNSNSQSPPPRYPRYERFKRDPRDPARPSEVLGVFGLNLMTTDKDIEKVFSQYGPLKKVVIIQDHGTGQSRGFGFIYFENPEHAKVALEKTNGMILDGRSIRVDFSVTQRPHSPTPGRYMGVKRSIHIRRSPPSRRRYSRSRSPRYHRSRRSSVNSRSYSRSRSR